MDIPLADGVYHAFVVLAETRDDDALTLDLAVTTGAHKGDVVSVRAPRANRDPLDVVGIPCTLRVERGQPKVEW